MGIFLLIILILGIAPVALVASSTPSTLPKGVTLWITDVGVAGGRREVAVGEVFDIFADAKYSGMPDHTQVDMVLYMYYGAGASQPQQILDIYTEYVTGSGEFGTVFSTAVQEAGSQLIWVGLWTSLVSIGVHDPANQISPAYVGVDALDVEMSLDVEYPNSNLAVGEEFPVIATVDYSNIPVNHHIEYNIWENSDEALYRGGLLGGYEARPDPIGIGKTGTMSHTFTTSLDSPGQIELRVTCGWAADTTEAGGNTYVDTETFLVNIVSVDSPSPSAQVLILDVGYAGPPDTVQAHEETPIIVEAEYGGLDEGSKLSVGIYDLSTGSFLGGEVSELLAGDGEYTFRPVAVLPLRAGSWSLRVDVEAVTAADIVAEATKDISMTVVAVEAAQVTVSTIEYVESPETIAVGEPTPVTVTAQYSDLISGSQLILWIEDLDMSVACEGGTLSSIVLSGSGTYTFPQLRIRPSTAGDWHLDAVVELNGDTVATKQFTMEVVSAGGALAARVNITKFLYVRDTIAVGETTPITVSIHFQSLPENTKLKAYINDEDAHTKVGSGTSTPLSGSGEYTFPNIVINPSRAGDWHLTVGVEGYPDAVEGFTIRVVAPEPQVKITSVKQPAPGKVRVGESAPVTVTISYQNLAAGTTLVVIVHDYDAHKDLSSVKSKIALSGTGTYTFPPLTVKPTRGGSWHLGVMISGYPETLTKFSITVA